MSKWVRLTYLTSYGKTRSHTIGGVTDPAKAVQELMDRYGIYPEHVLEVEVNGNPMDPKENTNGESTYLP